MVASRLPGPLGICAQTGQIDDGTSARVVSPLPGPLGIDPGASWPFQRLVGFTFPPFFETMPTLTASPMAIDIDTRMLAATAYGESSVKDLFEEMAAIANVLVRQQKAREFSTMSAFVKADKTFAFAAHDGSQRYAKLMAATPEMIDKDPGMSTAVKAAVNAMAEEPVDYSGGAFFWDGADIKTNYANHAKVLGGIHISDPAHNVYNIKDKQVPNENWLLDVKGKKLKLRGKWLYKYDSTAGWGGTIFWKYNADFIKASGNKVYK